MSIVWSMAGCERSDLALISLPDKDAISQELDILTGGSGTTQYLYHCPVRVGRGGPSIGHLKAKDVRCPLRPGEKCPVIQKIADDRHTSYVNIVHFKSHLPTTDHEHNGPALTEASRWKR